MKGFYSKRHLWLHVIIIIGAAFAVFSNNFHHDYPLDCGDLLLNNPSVRSFKNIPQYFIDSRTLTVNPANVDYRPVLQITYALNYAISKYDTWSWHLAQILLHIVCAVGLLFLCRRIIQEFHPDAGGYEAAIIPVAVSLLFVVHPATSGVINYLSARSSLLVAAFLMPSIALYMRPVYHGEKVKFPVLPAILYTLALFTKIEAIGALAVYFFYDSLQIAKRRSQTKAKAKAGGKPAGFIRDVWATINMKTIKKQWIFTAVTAIYCPM